MTGARWRSEEKQPSVHPTKLLFHVSDKHHVNGILPDFKNGETWEVVHDRLHMNPTDHEHER